MTVDDAAGRIYHKIYSYMKESGDAELSEEEQKVVLIGVIKVFIEEVTALATVAALKQTKESIDDAIKDASELYERIKKDGHL